MKNLSIIEFKLAYLYFKIKDFFYFLPMLQLFLELIKIKVTRWLNNIFFLIFRYCATSLF